MKSSGIGGQAVLEGIMMRNGAQYAIAVRKPDGGIAVEKREYHSIGEKHGWMRLPFIRGTFNFIDSLVVGITCMNISSGYYVGEEETPAGTEGADSADSAGEKASGKASRPSFMERHFSQETRDNLMTGFAVVLSIVISLALFMFLPIRIGSFFRRFTNSSFLIALIEGVIKMAVFITYISAISLMKDIRRTYMYHGAEHKCINCIEHGLPLTTANVRISSKEHKRCGTSFLLLVIVVSILVSMFITISTVWLRSLVRLALLPVVVGLSYEFIRLAGSSNNPVVCVLSKPGLWLQGLTTRQPDDDMIEVAIRAVEEVFDWKAYQLREFGRTADYAGVDEDDKAAEL